MEQGLYRGGYSWMDGPWGLSNKIPRKARFSVRNVHGVLLMGAKKLTGMAGAWMGPGGLSHGWLGCPARGRASVWLSSVCGQVSDTGKPRLNTEVRLLLVVVCSVSNCEPVSFRHDPSQDV